MERKLCIDEIDLRNKRVLIRVDFNVPIKDKKIANLMRIEAVIPTVNLALRGGAQCIILISHLGDPNGRFDDQYSLKPIAPVLSNLLGHYVRFLPECIGERVEQAIADSQHGSIILLENLRFYPEEQGNSVKVKSNISDIISFSHCLSKLGNVFVNDAFGTSHRADASMVGIKMEKRVTGLTMKRELQYLTNVLNSPPKPFLLILGGSKLSDKIEFIMNMLDKIDDLIIGGGIAFTFMKMLHGMEIGNSIYDQRGTQIIPRIMKKALSCRVTIHLPIDFIAASKYLENADAVKVNNIKNGIPKAYMGLDIGVKSTFKFSQVISNAKTIFWNGPMGVFEWSSFNKGTRGVLDSVVSATRKGALSILGGDDTTAACVQFGAAEDVTHLCTGGGTSLEFLKGNIIPGVQHLDNYDPRLDEGWKLAEHAYEQLKLKTTENDGRSEENLDCLYREHRCACEEIPEVNEPAEPSGYPWGCNLKNKHSSDPSPVPKGCHATEKLCQSLRCPLCCQEIRCKRRKPKQPCHPCEFKKDLSSRQWMWPEKSVYSDTGIKRSEHPHNQDQLTCIECESYFNRNIPMVTRALCKTYPCNCWETRDSAELSINNCLKCGKQTGACGSYNSTPDNYIVL